MPPSLENEVGAARLGRDASYVVVEEVVLGDVRTLVSVWPLLNEEGQLRFGDPEDGAEYVDSQADLQVLLDARRLVAVVELQERLIEVGDVFAVLGPVGDGSGGGDDGGGGVGARLVEALPDEPIYDITADARLAATATYSAATAGALSGADAKRFFDDGESGPHNQGGAPAPVPGGPGQGSGGDAQRPQRESLARKVVAEDVQVEVRRYRTAGA